MSLQRRREALTSSITITARLSPGQYPEIGTRIDQAPGGSEKYVVVSIIAVVTQPDHRIRSWSWLKVRIAQGASRAISVPKEYDTSQSGSYRAEILVYSADMKRRLATRAVTFEIAGRQKTPQQTREAASSREGACSARKRSGRTGTSRYQRRNIRECLEPGRRSNDLPVDVETYRSAGKRYDRNIHLV